MGGESGGSALFSRRSTAWLAVVVAAVTLQVAPVPNAVQAQSSDPVIVSCPADDVACHITQAEIFLRTRDGCEPLCGEPRCDETCRSVAHDVVAAIPARGDECSTEQCVDAVRRSAEAIVQGLTPDDQEAPCDSYVDCLALVEDHALEILEQIPACKSAGICLTEVQEALEPYPCYPADETVGCALVPVAVLFVVVGLAEETAGQGPHSALDDCAEGELISRSPICALRDADTGEFVEEPSLMAGDDALKFDNMRPTKNYSRDCFDGTQSSGVICQTDNRDLTVFMESSITATGATNIRETLDYSYDGTALRVLYQSSGTYSGKTETDIVYRGNIRDLPSDGMAWCDDAVSRVRCDQHIVAFVGTNPDRAIACHETGHAVGLTHGEGANPKQSNTNKSLACMTTRPISSALLGQHNAKTINRAYYG